MTDLPRSEQVKLAALILDELAASSGATLDQRFLECRAGHGHKAPSSGALVE